MIFLGLSKIIYLLGYTNRCYHCHSTFRSVSMIYLLEYEQGPFLIIEPFDQFIYSKPFDQYMPSLKNYLSIRVLAEVILISKPFEHYLSSLKSN